MMVVAQDIRKSLASHHLHRNTVGEADRGYDPGRGERRLCCLGGLRQALRWVCLWLDRSPEAGYRERREPTREETMMQVHFELPDDFAQLLQATWHDSLAHYARERLVMEACRDGLLTKK